MAGEEAISHMATMQELGLTEGLLYTAVGAGAAAVAREALVDREGSRDLGHGQAAALTATFLNDATYGIAAAELDAGSDTVDAAERAGGTAVSRHILRVAAQDGDWITLELQ